MRAYVPFTDTHIDITPTKVEKLTISIYEYGEDKIGSRSSLITRWEYTMKQVWEFDQEYIRKDTKKYNVLISERVKSDLDWLLN